MLPRPFEEEEEHLRAFLIGGGFVCCSAVNGGGGGLRPGAGTSGFSSGGPSLSGESGEPEEVEEQCECRRRRFGLNRARGRNPWVRACGEATHESFRGWRSSGGGKDKTFCKKSGRHKE